MGKLEKAEAAYLAAHDNAAVGIEFAEDFRDIGGVRFYRATVAHKWVLMKLSGEAFKKLDNYDKVTVTAYVLAHKMPEHLTALSLQMRKADILEKALTFFVAKGVDPECLAEVNELLQHPYAGSDETPTNPAP